MDDATEEWRPITGYEGIYEVSNSGRVRSLPRLANRGPFMGPTPVHGRILRPNVKKAQRGAGYYQLGLSLNGAMEIAAVHVLVCASFHGPRPSPNHQVRHLNGDSLDNRAANLVWGTRSENAQDILRHGNNHNANKTHCKRGHEYNAENTLINRNRQRVCRECKNSLRRVKAKREAS